MLLAQEHDAVEDGVPYLSTNRRRLIAPDTRSRVAGYLATAAEAAPGFRTDGTWVWPERLAEHTRLSGVAPQEQLLEHMRQRSFLLPDHVSATLLAQATEAVHGPAVPDPRPEWDWIHLGGFIDQTGPADALMRIRLREDGSVAESRYTPNGWGSTHAARLRPTRRQDPRQYVEVSGREAATINDRLCAVAHDAVLDRYRESVPATEGPWLARVFDGESQQGTPWFSPFRLRIPEPERRERLAAYLSSGRLVVRVTGRMRDPLQPDGEPTVPLSYRTDGAWVWPESLAYYVRSRGVAPELVFLCHIEEHGYQLPPDLPADVVPLAGAVVKNGPPPRAARPVTSYSWEPSGTIARSRSREPGDTDVFREDLRWNTLSPDRAWDVASLRDVAPAHREISEAEAVDFIDARWAAGMAVPPLD